MESETGVSTETGGQEDYQKGNKAEIETRVETKKPHPAEKSNNEVGGHVGT